MTRSAVHHQTLIDAYLPNYHFSERHSLMVFASAETILNAASSYDPSDDPIIQCLIKLRELPSKVLGGFRSTSASPRGAFGLRTFLFLGRRANAEVAYGLSGRFWRGDFGLVEFPNPQAFAVYRGAGVPKLVLNFSVTRLPDHSQRLTTETRVSAPDWSSLLMLTPYWLLIRPVSGFMRKRILQSIKRASENNGALQAAASTPSLVMSPINQESPR